MKEVMEILPISRRTWFRLFDSKEDFLLEIYKKASKILNNEVRRQQELVARNLNRQEAIQKRIDIIISVFVTHERHTQYIVEFDALNKTNDKILNEYNEFYQSINYILYFLRDIYEEDIYTINELTRLSFLILETAFGLVYRLITAVRSNYKYRIEQEDLKEIGYGLMSIVEKKDKLKRDNIQSANL